MNNCIILAMVIVSFVYPIQGLGGGFQHKKFKKYIISTYNKRYLVDMEDDEKADPNIGAENDVNDYGQDYDPEIVPDVIPPPLPLPPRPQDQPGSNGPCSGNLEFGWAYPSKKIMNNDLNWGATDKKNSPQECQAHCKRFPRCVGFTWVDGLNNCWLKHNMAAYFRDNRGSGFISGWKNTCISPAPWPLTSCGSKNICPGSPKIQSRPQPIESDPEVRPRRQPIKGDPEVRPRPRPIKEGSEEVGYKSCIMKCRNKYGLRTTIRRERRRRRKKCKNWCRNWKGAPNLHVLPQPQPIKGDPEVRPRPIKGDPEVRPQPRPIKGDPEIQPRPRPIEGDPEVSPRPRPIKGDPEVWPQPRPIKSDPEVRPRPRPIKGDPEVRPRPIMADSEFRK